MQWILKTSFGMLLLFVVTACNANSDAVRVLESENTSLRATLDSYKNTGPTMTAQATLVAQKVASLQSDLATIRAQNKDLISTLNAGAAQSPGAAPNPTVIVDAGTPGAPGVQGTPGAPQSGSTNFSFADVSTSKGIDASGCAASKATTFAATDQRIYVVADVRNLKNGTDFSVKWSGGDFTREDTWTARRDSAQLCIYFYIEPKTLALKAGTYTVTMSATGLTGTPVQFTVQ